MSTPTNASAAQSAQITFETTPMPMGWSIVAVRNGTRYSVAHGLISPEPSLKWCKAHLVQVEAEMNRVDAIAATQPEAR